MSERVVAPASDAPAVLVIEDTRLLRTTCSRWLENHGYRAFTAGDGAAAEEILERERIDVVVLDLGLPDVHGLDLMAEIAARDLGCQVIVMTAQATIENAVAAMRQGAADFITKPVDYDLLERSLHIALRTQRLSGENRQLRSQVESLPGDAGVVGEAPAMRELMRLVHKVAPTSETCLIVGENGTGKEVIARAIHRLSDRAHGAFVAVNCGAISEGLLESELFGHVKGAFSGADHARAGLFRQAEGGTLLLDEIGDMPPAMQVKLLRALESREVLPVGADRPVAIDIRVVAATNVDLAAAVASGAFREDLFYRLNVVPLVVPPLRERRGDIGLLARPVLEQQDADIRLTDEALELLERWSWPGNVRELHNVLRRACVLCDDEIRAEHLPERLRSYRPSGEHPIPGESGVLDREGRIMPLAELEQEAVQSALEIFGGDRTRSAQALGIDRTTLYRKLKRWGLE